MDARIPNLESVCKEVDVGRGGRGVAERKKMKKIE
jgi:hypothetical protein